MSSVRSWTQTKVSCQNSRWSAHVAVPACLAQVALTGCKLAVFLSCWLADRLSSPSSSMFLREQSHLCWHGLHQLALWQGFAPFLVSGLTLRPCFYCSTFCNSLVDAQLQRAQVLSLLLLQAAASVFCEHPSTLPVVSTQMQLCTSL